MAGAPSNVFQLELRASLAGRRAVALRVGLTLLLGFPFVWLDVPAGVRSTGLAMLVLFTGLFGSTVALARRRADGREERLRLLPLRPGVVAADLCLAGAAVDLVQTAPVVGLCWAVGGAPGTGLHTAVALAWLWAALAVLNAAGFAVSRLIRTGAEAHLFGALAVGAAAVASGLVPVPPRLAGVVEAVAPWTPVHRLAEALAALADGSTPPAPAAALAAAALLAGWCGARLADRSPTRP